METECSSEYDGSPDVSMEEEEEDEEGPQEQQLTCSSLKKLNQNEEVKSKLSDAMDTVQSEDSGLTWETSSSRCSTSQASETSTTSGAYSMENSFMDCPAGKVMFPMDGEKTAQKRPSSSPDQRPLSPNEKISTDSTKCDFSRKPMQVKAQERELDPSDPHSWPFQVQPSKIKDYLVQITQDTADSLPEEKENALMKKGELPLKGTVRARIQLITAVLEERHKKIFRRVNKKDLPPPSDVIRKPREQPKIFSRQGISVSLRHIERDATDKNNKKEILRYNLKHVETNISKSGASVPCNKDEKRMRRSFLPETLNKASEKPPPISSLLADKAKKPDTKSYSPGMQTSVPEQASFAPDRPDKIEKREMQALFAGTAKVTPEVSSNLLAETERQKMQEYSPLTTEDTDRSEKPKALLERQTVQPCSPVSAEPLSYPLSKPENQSHSMVTVLSETTAQDEQYPINAVAMQHVSEQSVSAETRNQDIEFTAPSQLEIKDTALLCSAEETGKRAVPLYSPEIAEPLPKQAELPPSVSSAEEQVKEESEVGRSEEEVEQEQLAMGLQAESGHLHTLHSVKEPEPGETANVTDLASTTSKIETQESQSGSYKTAETHPELLQPSYFTDKAEQKEKEHFESEFAKQAAPAQDSVTASLELKHPDVSHSRGQGEIQTAQPETQCPDSSLPLAYLHREETHLDSTAVAQPESEHPVISEPIKAPQGSEPLGPSHLKAEKVKQDSPVEQHSEFLQPSYFTGEAQQKEKEHLESEFTKQSAQAQVSVTTSLEPKHPDVSYSESQGEIQTAQPETQCPDSSLPLADLHREETHLDSTAVAQPENEHPVISEPIKAPQGSEPLGPSHLKAEEVKQDSPVEQHSEFLQPSYFTGEAQQKEKEHLESEFTKQSAQAQVSVTTSLEPKHPDVSYSESQGEIQTAQPETQCPDSSLPLADLHREETHLDSTAVAQPESEHPVISEPIKAPQGSEHLGPSHLKAEEVKQDSPVEQHSEFLQPSYFTVEAQQKEKEHLESEFTKQSAQAQVSVTTSLEPKHPDVSYSESHGEIQTAQPETRCPDSSLPLADVHREETHSDSTAVSQTESEHPVISEPIKALQGSEFLGPSHLKAEEVKQDSPVEQHSEFLQPSYFTVEAQQKEKEHLESEFTKQSAQAQVSVTTSLEPKHPDVSYSESHGEIQTAQPETQCPDSSLPLADVHREETHSDSTAIAQPESDFPVIPEPIKAPQGSEFLGPSHLKAEEVKQDSPVEQHSEFLQPSYFTGEAQQKEKQHLESEFTKQSAQAQVSVTTSLEPKHPDVSYSESHGEIQTAQPETQCPDSSLPLADVYREETHSDSTAVAQPESEHPVISEPIKAPQGSEFLGPSHLKAEEVKQDSPVEQHSEFLQPSYFTGEAQQKEKQHLESEFTKQSAQAQVSVTTSLEPKHSDVSYSESQGEIQTAQPETQCPDSSLPLADVHREETHSDSTAIAQPESDFPVIPEPIKAPQGSEFLGPSHLKAEEVKQDSPVEQHSEFLQPSYFTGEAQQKEKQHLESEFTKQSAQAQVSVTTSLEPKHPDVSYSESHGEIQTAQPETQCPDSSLPLADVYREETHSDSTAVAQPESEHPVISEPIKAPQGSEHLGPSHLKAEEVKQDSPVEQHSEFLQPSYFTGEAQQKEKEHLESEFTKQSAQAQVSVTTSLEPKHPDVSYSESQGEIQTAQPETQCPDSSLPLADVHREETHSDSTAVAQPESEHPVISEPIKAPQGSEHLGPSHLKAEEVKQDSPVEQHSEFLQPSYFTGEAQQKEKEHLESEFTKQSAQAQVSVTTSLEPKHPDVSYSESHGEIQTAQPETQCPDSSLPLADVHREETHSDSTAVSQPESEHPVISEPIKAPQGSEHLGPSHLKAEEVKQDSPVEQHSEFLQPSYFTGEAQQKEKEHLESEFTKQSAQAQVSVTTSLEPKHPDVSYSESQGEIQTAQPETQCPDSSLPLADVHREETHSDSTAVAQPESEHPVISEPIKAPQGSEHLGPSHLKAEEVKQDSPVEQHSEFLQPSYFTGEAQQKEKEHLESEFTKQSAQAQVSVTTSLEPKHSDVSYSESQGEIQTAQPETQCPDSSLPLADVYREETHSDSTAVSQTESEHPVISEPIKAPQGSEPLGPSHLKCKEENKYSPAEALHLSEQLPPISSLLTENTEKQEIQLTSLVTATPLSKQPHSVLPCPTEQMAKQEALPQPPEIPPMAAEASLIPAAFQNEEVAEVEFQPLLPREVSSEELLLIAREPDVAMERKTTHLVSPLPSEPPSEASVLSQEEVRLENQLYPSINVKLCSESQGESQPTINEGQQEGWFELDRLDESQSRKQTMKQNSSVSFQLEETIALHSVDDGDRNDRHPDKPITEPWHPDPLHPVCVLEKQERAQTDIEKTTQLLSHTVLPMEADTLQSAEEAEINGNPPHLPTTAQNVSNSVYLMGTQEKQCVLTETATLDSVPSITAEAEKYNTTEPESKHMEKQSIHALPAELELDYPNVSHAISESGKPLDVSFPVPSAEERALQSHQSVTSESDEGPISSERKREEAGLHSLMTPTSELECPTAASETQGSQKDLFDSSLNEASEPSLVMVTFVPDEIKHQVVAAETTVSSGLASEQTNFLLPELKDKAEIEGSQFPFPAETQKMVPEDSPSFTTFPIGEAREEPLYSPMPPKIEPEESNSIAKDFVSVEVKEMAPPVSELLSLETISSYPAAVGEKQDQSKHMGKQTIQAETAELETVFPNVTHSGSEAGKLLDASSPVPSIEEGDRQSHLPVTPEWEGEHPVSSEREKEESGLYPFITPTSKVECPTAASETQGSQNDLFDSSLNEASKPSLIMVSFVPDEIKHQAVAAETTVSSGLASEQTNFLSPELKDKAEIEGSHFPFPAAIPKMLPEESPPFTTFPIGEAREEPLCSPMTPRFGPEESNSIPEGVVSEEVKEIHPRISLYATVGEKQDRLHSFVNEESLAAGKEDMQDAQFNLLITAQSEMRNQDIKPYCPTTTQPELEDLTLLNSTEEVRKQETPLCPPSALPSAPIHQELLGHKGDQETQERITLEGEHSKECDAPLKSSSMQQELEQLKLLQSVKESAIEGNQSHSSITVQDSPQAADETGRQQHQGYVSQTAEVGSGVSILSELMDEAKKQELPPPLSEVAQLECKQSVLSTEEWREVQHPLDLGHLGLSYSTETQFSSSEARNQTSKQPPSVSSLLTKKVEDQEVKSHPAAASMSSSVLSQSSSAPLNLMEEDEKQKNQPCSPEVANVMPEEPLSIAAFLLSQAKTIHAYFPQTSETENLDAKSSFKEAGLLIERSGSPSALPPETNVMIKSEDKPSTTHFESEQFASKAQEDVISRCSLEDIKENIPDIPSLPNVILNEPSNALILEPINYTHALNLHSSVSFEDSNTIANKAMVERALKDPENYLQKEKDLKDYEKRREESIPAPELDQGNDTFAISEDYEEANIHAPPLISSAEKEDKHVLESLEYLGKVPVLKAKPFDEAEDVVVDHEPSVCKLSGKTLEGLKADNRENKGNESKELVKEKGAQENVETTMEVSSVPENMGDSILNATRIDYIEKYTLIDDASFTQKGKEQSIKDVQRPFDVTNENSEEGTSPVASSENILEFSLLEREFDKAKKENTHEDTSKTLNEDETVRGNDENTEGEPNLVGADASLFNPEKDELSRSPSFPSPVTAVSPELLEVPPTLAFLYKDLYKEIVEETKEDSSKYPPSDEIDMPFHTRGHVSDDGSGIYLEKDIPDDYTPNNLEESQKEKVLKYQPISEQALNQTRVSEITREPGKKVHEPIDILAEANAHKGLLSPSGLSDTLTERPAEIVSDIKVGICQPTHAIPFGSGLYSSGASNDDSSQRREEETLSEETDQALPEETSDEESSPILDYAATVYQNEALVQDESQDIACLAVDQNQQSEITEVHEVDNYVVKKTVEESTHSLEASQHVDSHWQSEGQPEGKLMSALDEPMAQDAHPLDQEHLPYWDTERQTSEKSIGENIAHELTEHTVETIDQLEPEAINDKPFVELDYSLLSHDFDTYPLYSIKEEEYSDVDEDLAELMDYEMVGRDDVFQEETSSEAAHEELLFDDRKSSDHISDSYEFVNEREASMYAEEEAFELMDSGNPPRSAPETEILQKEIEQADLDTYCYQCKCPISGEDKLFGGHKEHDVTDLDTAVALLKGQLNGFLDVLQERSLKIEGFVGEIEALFNSLEENCKEKEQLLEEQNESIVKMVIGHHDRKAQSFEEIKNTKMEYLYEKMVNFQEYIDTAKDTLEAIIKETEGMDDFVFLKSSEEINKRLLSAVENILTLEKMPAAFSQFKHYAGGSANGEQTLKHMPVPQTPKLQPQDPSSATSTSIAVYWTVNEDDVIDFFQVYCMEEYPGSKEQSGLVEEYRVTVKESNCILEDLEPGHSYSVWVMAVNHTGCSFPSEKSTFRTAPPTPVIKAEECTVCSDTATIRWSTGHPEATDSFTLEYCRQYSPEGEGLRSLAGIKRPEMKVRLESNLNYFFYVRAVNTFGMSEQSEAALISTKGTRFHIMKGTAHPALQVSLNGTMICLAEDSKFAGTSPVLGELLSARGRHYWETTVSGCAAYKVGICYSPVRPDSVLGQNKTSWCLHCPSKASFVYKVLHNGEMSDVIVTEQPPRIGILLDYNTGRLLFFNAERGQVLSAIRHKFTEAAHPTFVLEQPGVLNLHTGMELPEFVEQS